MKAFHLEKTSTKSSIIKLFQEVYLSRSFYYTSRILIIYCTNFKSIFDILPATYFYGDFVQINSSKISTKYCKLKISETWAALYRTKSETTYSFKIDNQPHYVPQRRRKTITL